MEYTKRPLRIALDTSYAGVNPTGVGLYSRRLASTMRRLAPASGVSLHCYGPSCERSQHTLISTMQEWPLYTQGVLPLLLASKRADVVHSTSHIGPLWGPGRLVVTVHDLIFRRFPADYDPIWLRITLALLPRVLARATAIIADSHATKEDIRRYYNIRPGKIHVIYPAIDRQFRRTSATTQSLTNTRRKYGLGNDSYIICVGPWVARKNLSVVVAAFEEVAARSPNVRLVITGDLPRGMKGTTPEQMVGALPPYATERVHAVGFVPKEELVALVSGATVLAYPSRYEGFGLPPLEAMAAGVPVVASDTPAVAEVTASAALLASVDSPREWAAALASVLTNPDRAAQLRAAGLRRSADFSWERCAKETIALYKRVANV
ncbi:MAG: glycosyltransferase family 4 protein [Chloroflexota bacterium]|nr:glycosyltransferase family 4 protein [Chloroflexota bacterium]